MDTNYKNAEELYTLDKAQYKFTNYLKRKLSETLKIKKLWQHTFRTMFF